MKNRKKSAVVESINKARLALWKRCFKSSALTTRKTHIVDCWRAIFILFLLSCFSLFQFGSVFVDAVIMFDDSISNIEIVSAQTIMDLSY